MADCYIVRRGGGGSGGLNFEVVGGTTQPTSPKENTIWINTGAEITSWVFSAIEPASPVEGIVQIMTDTTSEVAFSVLKKDEIYVYPIAAKQLVNGAWEQKTATIYQNGSWNALWDGYIYYQGDLKEKITGGWEHNSGNTGSFSAGSSYLTISASGSSGGSCYYRMINKIDLTLVKSIEVVWKSSNSNRSRFVVRDDSNSEVAAMYTTPSMQGTQHTSYLDVSELSGEYRITAGVWFAETTSVTCTIYSIKLEF